MFSRLRLSAADSSQHARRGALVAITGVGHYVPEERITNADLAMRLDTTDEWIRTRTGIAERRRASSGGTSDLIVRAARACLASRGLEAAEIDCVIVATSTPDYVLPPTAAIVQRKLGIPEAWGFDLSAACSGFLYALTTAASLVESGRARRVLLCGGDRMTLLADERDRSTAVLFGDGAGVVLVEAADDPAMGLLDCICRTCPVDEQHLWVPAGGSARPASLDTVLNREHYLMQDGQVVFRAAVAGMSEMAATLLHRNDVAVSDIAWLVPHQANARIMDAVARRLGVDSSHVASNVELYGNTNAATVPLCLSEYAARGCLQYGDRVLLVAFGAGFTMGAAYLTWSVAPLRSVSTHGFAAFEPHTATALLPSGVDA